MDPDVQILTNRVDAIETTMRDALIEIRDGIREIATNTGKLAVLEERHAETRDGLTRAFAAISRLESKATTAENKVIAIEGALVPLKEARGWMIAAAAVVIVAVIGAVLAMVVRGGA